MEEIIEYLKERIKGIKASNKPMNRARCGYEDGCIISGYEAQKIIDFYESNKKESEETPNVQDTTPEWDKIPEGFDWVGVDRDGEEVAHMNEPTAIRSGFWIQHPYSKKFQFHTGREFDMDGIDWTKTLSKRPQ